MVPFQIVDPAIEIPRFFKFPFSFKFHYMRKRVIKILYLKIVTDRAGVNVISSTSYSVSGYLRGQQIRSVRSLSHGGRDLPG
jgi:hypothetical protein